MRVKPLTSAARPPALPLLAAFAACLHDHPTRLLLKLGAARSCRYVASMIRASARAHLAVYRSDDQSECSAWKLIIDCFVLIDAVCRYLLHLTVLVGDSTSSYHQAIKSI